ncbi:MAG: 2-amino-4-hydroxy-6-hydroxymethyldihydropteridine diphosphokinase [Treponema sp.]|nr:2-amino-4-hydroxy-6-hydroxymethyldihydropteridine diphosphokinase [Treponema sp.]
MGESAAVFRSAFRALGEFLRNPRLSSFYRTQPRYLEDQPPFLNAAVSGRTLLDPRQLLAAVQSIESAHGRNRSREVFKGPRTLDIDILLYGDAILSYPELVVPHPGLQERLFALVPLLELAPDLADPRTGRPFRDLAAELPDQGIYLEVEAGL